jgi:ribose/xylose/arabinose/galactoside ABC-type transport system permease subunit
MSTMLKTPPLAEFQLGASVRRVAARRDAQLIAVIVAIVVVSSAAAGAQFFSARLIASFLIAAMVTAFVALGQTFVVITRGIDLSVSPILGLSAVCVGFLAQGSGFPLGLGLLLGAGIGAVLGVGNGLLVSGLGLPPIIATLGTFSVYGGLQFLITNGNQVNTIPSQYTQFGVATFDIVPGVPWLLLGGVAATLIVGFVLRYTVFGRNLFATGGDVEAAFRAGIPTRRVIFLAYVICGLLAGVAGVIYLMRTGSANAITGTDTNQNLNSIAAALIGGTALTGGRGSATGALLASIFLALSLNAMGIAAHIPVEWQPAGVGVLILLAVIADPRARQGRAIKSVFARRRTR